MSRDPPPQLSSLVSLWHLVVFFLGILRIVNPIVVSPTNSSVSNRYDTGTIGGILAMNYWVKEFAQKWNADGDPYISASQKSLIVSILSAGTFFGALTAAPCGDFLGRRWGLIASCAVFTIGVICQTISTETALFSVGRFIAGYGVGLVSALGKDSRRDTAF